ncbi:MAG: hypothetical protein LC637_14770 [Xanthomonadaceae bacterium]|nr:hypothetical protein [Xanthomonadaceae bacterium]
MNLRLIYAVKRYRKLIRAKAIKQEFRNRAIAGRQIEDSTIASQIGREGFPDAGDDAGIMTAIVGLTRSTAIAAPVSVPNRSFFNHHAGNYRACSRSAPTCIARKSACYMCYCFCGERGVNL